MLLTVEQAAERLQIHQETVRRHLQAGTLRGIKRGRVWRVPEAALLESSPLPIESAGADTQAVQCAFDLFNSDPKATGARSVDDFLTDRRGETQAEFSETETTPDLDALFAPPTPAEIARRLAALDAFKGNDKARTNNATPLTDDAVAQGYEDRAAQIMEGHR